MQIFSNGLAIFYSLCYAAVRNKHSEKETAMIYLCIKFRFVNCRSLFSFFMSCFRPVGSSLCNYWVWSAKRCLCPNLYQICGRFQNKILWNILILCDKTIYILIWLPQPRSYIIIDMKMENIYIPVYFAVSCVGDSMYT